MSACKILSRVLEFFCLELSKVLDFQLLFDFYKVTDSCIGMMAPGMICLKSIIIYSSLALFDYYDVEEILTHFWENIFILKFFFDFLKI